MATIDILENIKQNGVEISIKGKDADKRVFEMLKSRGYIFHKVKKIWIKSKCSNREFDSISNAIDFRDWENYGQRRKNTEAQSNPSQEVVQLPLAQHLSSWDNSDDGKREMCIYEKEVYIFIHNTHDDPNRYYKVGVGGKMMYNASKPNVDKGVSFKISDKIELTEKQLKPHYDFTKSPKVSVAKLIQEMRLGKLEMAQVKSLGKKLPNAPFKVVHYESSIPVRAKRSFEKGVFFYGDFAFRYVKNPSKTLDLSKKLDYLSQTRKAKGNIEGEEVNKYLSRFSHIDYKEFTDKAKAEIAVKSTRLKATKVLKTIDGMIGVAVFKTLKIKESEAIEKLKELKSYVNIPFVYVPNRGIQTLKKKTKPKKGEQLTMELNGVDDVNKAFNEKLELYKKGKAKGDFKLGFPTDILLKNGIAKKPIILTIKSLNDHLKKKLHKNNGLTANSLKDLPIKIGFPIMVFNGNNPKSYVVVLDSKIRGNNIAITFSEDYKKVNVHFVNSVHPKTELKTQYDEWRDKLIWEDKNKVDKLFGRGLKCRRRQKLTNSSNIRTSSKKDTSSQKKSLDGVMSLEDVATTEYKTIGLDGQWRELIGDACHPTKILVTGKGGTGKSGSVLKFSEYLTKKGFSVLYVAGEQFGTPTFKELIKAVKLDIKNPNITIVDSLERRNPADYDLVVIDSKDSLKMTIEDFRTLDKQFGNNTSFIVLSQATKDGEFSGSK